MNAETNTQSLLFRVRTGDAEALNLLYERYLHRVLAVVRARLGPELRRKVESWDVVQDAMLASLRDVQTFDYQSEGAFIRWLSQVVENKIRDQVRFHHAECRDHRREQSVPTNESRENAHFDIAGSGPVPGALLELSEDLALLEKAMDSLSDDERELLVAVKIEGRSYSEIAQETSKSPDAVRMRANRAMAALTQAFQRLGSRDGG